MSVLFARIPDDRVGALIGPGGSTRREIEQKTKAHLEIDADEGAVGVSNDDSADPIGALQARDIVVAIGRGFSPERAMRLLQDDTYLGVIDIKQVTGKHTKSALWRIRSRLIGTAGRARGRIEQLSGCSVSIYGSTVALIGKEKELERATQAVELLLRGSEHSTVFHLLARLRNEANRAEAIETPDLPDAE
ncbi:MAG: KH domain-containing protein [Thermoplasmata archaeon]|nr:KH domain-containing protein [Thermoplasmata archaeon]